MQNKTTTNPARIAILWCVKCDTEVVALTRGESQRCFCDVRDSLYDDPVPASWMIYNRAEFLASRVAPYKKLKRERATPEMLSEDTPMFFSDEANGERVNGIRI